MHAQRVACRKATISSVVSNHEVRADNKPIVVKEAWPLESTEADPINTPLSRNSTCQWAFLGRYVNLGSKCDRLKC